MKFFIDTANLQEIKTALSWGVLDGVTTNPSLIAREGRPFKELAQEICQACPGPVSLETIGATAEQMVAEGRELAKISDNVVVKLPTSLEALRATKILGEDGIRVNMTLCFSPIQGLLAAKAGAAYISPFVGRLDDIAQNGLEMVSQLKQIYDQYGYTTEILVASVRHPIHVVESAMMGADVATVPFKVMEQFIRHPLTDSGLAKFLEDWKKVS